VDLVIAAGLAVVAFLLRHHGLPTDGLWLDDSITGAGLTASPSDLLTVSADHPGFIVTLMGWRDLTGGSDAALTYPVLAAGTLGPALLYLGLRWCGYERSISALLAAVLAVAETDVIYSGRVRTYTIDVLIVLALALVIPRLTQIRWRWWTGIAWIAAGALLAFWSGFALIAVAVAGGIIALHPASDLRWRAVAVGVQEAICIALLVAQGHTHNLPAQEDNFRRTWDAFVDFSPNPITFGGEAFIHLRRVGEYFVGGPAWFAGLCVAVAIIGLAIAAWRGRQALRARYLLLLLVTAFVAGVLGKFPFGPSQGDLISSGGRVSLWLIPVVAIGLAAVMRGVRSMIASRRFLAFAFDAGAFAGAVVILVVGLARDPVPYPFPGPLSATEYVQSHLGGRDALLIGSRSDWSFATETSFKTGVRRTPDSSIGFQPDFPDPRIHYLDALVDRGHVAPEVASAHRVFVYYAGPPFSKPEAQLRTELASTLGSLGFAPESTPAFQYAGVQVWTRAGRRARAGNLGVSDLPQGWTLAAPANPPLGTRVLACMGIDPDTPADAVTANGPQGENVISQLDRWQSASVASQAVAAFRRPTGAACFRSVLEQSLSTAGIPLDVNVDPEPPPPDAGPHAAAYHVTALSRSAGTPAAEGSVLFFSRGRTSAQLVALRGGGKKPSTQALMADLAATLAQRIGS
jgi:hypothetical protein